MKGGEILELYTYEYCRNYVVHTLFPVLFQINFSRYNTHLPALCIYSRNGKYHREGRV